MTTILIVDDEKPVRQFLTAAFEQEGHKVLEAWHGRHALDIIAGHPRRLDLVISDVMMPLMGGVELCKTLRADPSTADILIVLMSAAHLRGAMGVGADAIIGKPFDLEALDTLVHRLLAARTD